ncbi:LicD family protein [Veillonella sp.]|uniref:LicD family protein n=1 Tax=Veillonella sp. TaxID=1926307 RepID=UPI0025DEBF5A|nr:LicD family protein [Veillonella sp.]
MRQLTLQEVKKCEVEILNYFDGVCRKYNLKYYLSGGTLLGAIRHKGFIPWDDDIDVCMPRIDYERMIQYLGEKNDGRYILKTIKHGELIPFVKIVDINTHINSKYNDDSTEQHIWIDVFPVDGLPNEIAECQKLYKKVHLYMRLLSLEKAKLGEGRSTIKKFLKFFIKPILKVYGAKRIVNKLIKLSNSYKYETSEFVGCVAWGTYGIAERMNKKEFEVMVEVEFEGNFYPSFSCWQTYLTNLYGDYMELPPIEKRISHEITAYIK